MKNTHAPRGNNAGVRVFVFDYLIERLVGLFLRKCHARRTLISGGVIGHRF